jgi:AcrR family transcriptional regulator
VTVQKRPYRKKRRAESEAGTRRRIAESAAELHGTLGPSLTSLSAIAEHAGVRRSTLYRHFPDEAALFAACTAHWLAANPLPDLGRWTVVEDPHKRLRLALREMYAFYGRNERMLSNLLRDEETVPVVKQHFAGFRGYIEAGRQALMSGRHARGAARRRVLAALGHALAFTTWRSLVREQGLEDAQAAELMCRLVEAASLAAPKRP